MTLLRLLPQRAREHMPGSPCSARSRQTLLMPHEITLSLPIAYSERAQPRSDEAIHPPASGASVTGRNRARGSGHSQPSTEGLKEKRSAVGTARAALSL